MGRQVFSHSNPKGMVSALKAIHDSINVEQAMQEFGLLYKCKSGSRMENANMV